MRNEKAELLGFQYSYIKNGLDTRTALSLLTDRKLGLLKSIKSNFFHY
jgi:hypothetical protein